MRKVESLIVGAGISGLTYADFCGEDYLIVEKADVPGGLCRTFYEGEYVWDCAGHFFHFSDEKFKRFFEKKIDKSELVSCRKNTKIFYNNLLIDYPFQMNIHQLPKDEFIDCLYDLFNRDEKSEYGSFQEMLYGKFGRSITEKFLKPYNEKLYACDLNILDTDAMGRFFPYANVNDIVKNFRQNNVSTYNDYFEYPKRGAETFVNALMENVDSSRLLLGCELKKIDTRSHIAEAGDEIICYDKLISTIPLNDFISLEGLEEFSDILPGLHSNTVLVFNMGFDKKSDIDDIHWIYFPDKKFNFYRVGFYDNILGSDKLSIYVEIGFDSSQKIDVRSQLEMTLSGLKKSGIITDHRLVDYNTLIIPNAYVHITAESKRLVKDTEENLRDKDIYITGRYGKWTYCSIEDCMMQAVRLAEKYNL